MSIQEFQTWLSSEDEEDEYKEMLVEITQMNLDEINVVSNLLFWW